MNICPGDSMFVLPGRLWGKGFRLRGGRGRKLILPHGYVAVSGTVRNYRLEFMPPFSRLYVDFNMLSPSGG